MKNGSRKTPAGPSRRSAVWRYGGAVLIVALTLLAQLLVRQFLPLNPLFAILTAILLSAWYGGIGPSILSAVAWSFLVNLFIGRPHGVFEVHLNDGDIPRLIVAVFIAVLAGYWRRADEGRRTRAAQQAVIARMGLRALELDDLDALMQEAIEQVAETVGADQSSVMQYVPERNCFVVRAGVGWRDGIIGRVDIPYEDSISGLVLRGKGPLVVRDIRRDERLRIPPELKSQGWVSVLATEIPGPARPFGVIGAGVRHRTNFNDDDLNFLQAIAHILTAAIERHASFERLENQRRWLTSVLDRLPVAIVFFEPGTTRATFANRVANHLAGGEFELHKSVEEIGDRFQVYDLKGNRLSGDQVPAARAGRGESVKGEQIVWRMPDGDITLLVNAEYLPAAHGQEATVMVTFQDISHIKRIEAQLQQASRLKDEFLATVSHELRTPLNAILGWARMLRAGKLDAESYARGLETIERNANAQAQIISDLLDVSRIISGKLRLTISEVHLLPVIEAATEAVRPAIEAKNIGLHLTLDPGAGRVRGDASRLQQVIWNLLANAVKFTPAGGEVFIDLRNREGFAEIEVRDTGAGINPDFLPFVFDRFRQGDSSLTREHGGLGLGLSIVRHLVEAHGGTITASSGGKGQGATFIVSLPLKAKETAAPALPETGRRGLAQAALGGEVNLPLLDGMRLMVVDDDSDARELLTLMLKQHGAEVAAVASVAEAMRLLKEQLPDVLVTDIEMPGEDGYSLIHRLRAGEVRNASRLPAIALTAHARVEDRLRAITAGFQYHISKPVEAAELVAVLANLRAGNGNARGRLDA